MTLREAIMAAAKFALPHLGRDPAPMSGVRLLPRNGEFPARIFASRGSASILLDVDDDLPNLVIDAVGIDAALRSEPDAQVKLEGDLVAVGRYRFRPWCLPEAFPGMPSIPPPEFFQRIPDTTLIEKVLHAVGKDPARPELSYVSFRPGYVEAVDGPRFARVPVGVNRTVQIHNNVFAQWPGGPCEFAVEDSVGAVFRWPGEIRWGEIYRGTSRPYPDLSRIPDDPPGATEVVVSVDPFRSVVRKATSVSPVKVVACRFRDGAVDVAAMLDERGTRFAGYQDKVPALCRGTGSLAISGTALSAALAALDTPRVLLGVQGPTDALTVRAGSFVEHIYPIQV